MWLQTLDVMYPTYCCFMFNFQILDHTNEDDSRVLGYLRIKQSKFQEAYDTYVCTVKQPQNSSMLCFFHLFAFCFFGKFINVRNAFAPLNVQSICCFSLDQFVQNNSVIYRLVSATKQNTKSVDANLWLGQVCYLMSNKDKETAKYLLTVRI